PSIGSELIRAQVGSRAVLSVHGPRQPRVVGPARPAPPSPRPLGHGVRVDPPEPLALFEDVPYEIRIYAPQPIALELGDHSLPLDWGRPLSADAWVLGTARVTLRALGWARFYLPELQQGLAIPVRARKLDYDQDYWAMLYDLEETARGLAARLHSTSREEVLEASVPIDLGAYWRRMLEALWEDMAQAISRAWAQLPVQAQRLDTVAAFDRLKRPRPADVRLWHQRQPPRQAVTRLEWVHRIPERQYLLDLLDYLLTRLKTLPSSPPLARMRRSVKRLRLQLCAELPANRLQPPPIPQGVLAQTLAPLQQVIQLHRRLNHGLLLSAGPIGVALEDVHRLYEYWVYLRLVATVVTETGGTLQDGIGIRRARHPLEVVFAEGQDQATIRLRDGRRLQVGYQPYYQRLPTVDQQPDNVITVTGDDTLLIFDAKYRFEHNETARQKYAEPGLEIPPIEAINQMHQYRDAIVIPVPPSALTWERRVRAAVTVFPLPADQHPRFADHRFWHSIGSVQVGAVPLLPGHDTLFRQVVRDLLGLVNPGA
ncbi:MAG: DUF2357 domain-containing protein, partial [Firmicutes bacterium]|nr:DUF2357 domain-containing protein [Bacillota bacterium]